jgi:ABC-type dipeptide/oligopeptide/nickel transport system permease subunit
MTEPSDSRAKVTGAPVSGLAVGQPALAAGLMELTPPSTELSFESGLEVSAHSQWWHARHRFVRHRLAMGSLITLTVIFVAGALARTLAPYGRDTIDITAASQGPSWHHLFGTDQIGRDYFSRTLYGIQTTEKVSILVAVIATTVGIIVGAFSGYYGGWADNTLMRVTDLFLVVPALAVLLVASKYLGHGSAYRIAIILGLLFWTSIARIVRGSYLSLKEKEFVEAARASGAGDFRIMFRHILPNLIGAIVVSATAWRFSSSPRSRSSASASSRRSPRSGTSLPTVRHLVSTSGGS